MEEIPRVVPSGTARGLYQGNRWAHMTQCPQRRAESLMCEREPGVHGSREVDGRGSSDAGIRSRVGDWARNELDSPAQPGSVKVDAIALTPLVLHIRGYVPESDGINAPNVLCPSLEGRTANVPDRKEKDPDLCE